MYRLRLCSGSVPVAVALLATSVPVTAQRASSTEAISRIEATLTVRHDSNVARGNSDQAVLRGVDRADQRATPALQLTFARPLGRNSIDLYASAGYDFYRRNTRLNSERLTLGGTGTLAAGPCDLALSPSFSRRQSDLADLAVLATPGIDSVRNIETIQNYAAELRCGSGFGWRPVATIERGIGDNSAERRQLSDYRTFRYGGGVAYTNPVVGDFTLQYSRNTIDYPRRPAIAGADGYRTDRIELRGERDIGAILTANGSLSYIDLKPDQSGVEGFSGLGWRLGLTATPTPDLQLTAGLGRDTTPSLGTDALYQVNRSYSLGAAYALTSALSLSLRGTLDDRDYEGGGMIFARAPLTSSALRSITAGVSMQGASRLGVSIDVGYQNRNANGTFYDYNNTYAAVRTTFRL